MPAVVPVFTEEQHQRHQRDQREHPHRDVARAPAIALDQRIEQHWRDDAHQPGTGERQRQRHPAAAIEPGRDGPRPHQRRGAAAGNGKQEQRHIEPEDARPDQGHREHAEREECERGNADLPHADPVGEIAHQRPREHEAGGEDRLRRGNFGAAPAERLAQRADEDAEAVDRHPRDAGRSAHRRRENYRPVGAQFAAFAHLKAPSPVILSTSG